MTDRLDLPSRYRDQIEALLREHVPGVEVWAYGSRVNGESHDASDLDLVLRGPDLERIPSGQLADLNEALEESNVPIIVQVHDWARLPESFHREIERAYVVLVEGEEQGMNSEWRTIEIPLPPLPKQRAIAHILGTLDDKIELNRRMNETLEEMARALLKSWFVDFDPVRAKMEGRDPGLPTHLADLFPDRLVDSELGPIPEGWEVKALDEVANFRNGLALQKFRPTEDEKRLPVVKIAQLRSGQADSGEWATENITTECIIDDGDIVFSWSGSLMVKIWCGGRAALNQHLFKVTSPEYPKWFYLHWIEFHLSEFRSIAADKATTMGHIKRQHLSEAKCAVPDLTRLAVANVTFTDLLSKRISNTLESNALSTLRDVLLPKLVSGELRVDVRVI